LANSTVNAYASPPFRPSLSAHTGLRPVLPGLHGGVGWGGNDFTNYGLKNGGYDNVSACHYEIPDYWTVGEVYERLIEDICEENYDIDFIVDTLIKVYSSWIDKAISNYNSDFFYQSRQYIFECWKAGDVI
jgi:hypothetical protein